MDAENKSNGSILKFNDIFQYHLADAVSDSLWLFNMDYCDNKHLLEIVIANLQCNIEREYYSALKEEFYNVYGEETDEEHHIMKLATAMNDSLNFYKNYE